MTWMERLEEAERTGKLETEENIMLAGNWTTCAVGEMFGIKKEADIPVTVAWRGLVTLGLDFSIAVQDGKLDVAKELLTQIEAIKAMQVKKDGTE